MAKFRKRPVVVEAVQLNAANFDGVSFDSNPLNEWAPDWFLHAFWEGRISIHPSDTDYARWRIVTLEDGKDGEAKHIADPGDWIVRGVKGELYPVKPDIFALTYEPAEG